VSTPVRDSKSFTGYFFAQGRLDHLGVVQVRGNGGADFDDEVSSARRSSRSESDLVDRVQDLLVISHFVVDVRPVERGALQAFEILRALGAPVFRLWLVGLSSGLTPSFFASAPPAG